MASNLTDQVRSISEVTKAVANGDLSRTINVDVQGEMLELKTTVNQMVARLSILANEVTRVSLEVGTEGIMGGQAFVPDVQGMWKVCCLGFGLWDWLLMFVLCDLSASWCLLPRRFLSITNLETLISSSPRFHARNRSFRIMST